MTQQIASLRQRLQRDPADLQSRIQLAALLDSQGGASEAEDVLRAALQRGQRTPEVFHALGTLYLRNKLFNPAAEAFYIETKLKPDDFLAHLNLATTFSYLGKAEKAQREFEIAHKLNPSASDPYLGLAFLNDSSERYPYAVRYLKEYLQRTGQPGPGYALLCRVYLHMRLYNKAIETGKAASNVMPDNASVWYNLGEAYVFEPKERNLPDAMQAFERALQLAPGWGNAHFELARVYSRLNRPADAIAQYREAVRYEPTQGKYYYQLGQLLVQQGQPVEGRQMLTKAQTLLPLNQRQGQLLDQLSATPKVPRLMFALALVYKQLGQYELAQNWLRSVLQVDPNYPQAHTELRSIERLAASK